MRRLLLPLPFLLLAAATDEVPFEPSAETFSSAEACKAHLAELTRVARAEGYDAVEGPYGVGATDVRVHKVRAEGAGHRITEHRCLAEKLSGRSWSHAMEEAEPEFTVDSVARTAPWLNKDRAEQ